ncbi:hypothetical protein F5050DRAFT_744626 [Lentinula boryana]|uniref:Proteophosphoglycan 5 n=1 Tax=Lentinula boryana TaxID=40481 RepID=A0ABQ8Q4I5_9AGAR|nr:hypothetical protein F5050DRAFT_744626 [Lentinula boryana]
MFSSIDEYLNASTESLISTQYLSLSGRDSAPASPMSSTFFDADLSARSVSPVPSNYALYTRSRPTSTDSSILDFQSFAPIPPTQLQPAIANTDLMEKVAEDLCRVAASPVSDKASLMSKQTTRSRAVRRSDTIEPVTEAEQGPLDAGTEGQTEKKKARRFLPKFFRRALSTSGALNAQILDRNAAPSKPGPRPFGPSARANTSPVVLDPSITAGKGKEKAHSMFRFRPKADSSLSKKPTHTPPPLKLDNEFVQRRRQVRRSGSFAGFSGSAFTPRPSSPLIFQREGLFSTTHDTPAGGMAEDDEDGLDALTLEASALSAQIGRRWVYAEDEI